MSESLPGEPPQADDIRRPPPEGNEKSGQATFAHEHPQADDIRRPPPEGDEQSGQATFAHEIASERCQRARRAEWVDTQPALYRSEGFFEDLAEVPPPALRFLRSVRPAPRPVWAGVLVHALGLRRT